MLLHNPVEPIGDWLCFKDYIVIRIYGFEGEAFKFPKFTSRRLFALEYLRQRLIAENDNFIKHKKASSMKFNFTIEPFVVKSTYAIIAIDQILRSMNFETDKALRYDPKGVMHQRRMDMNFKGYDVDQDEVLVALANTDLFEQLEVGDRSNNSSERSSLGKATDNQTKVPTPLKGEKSLKRHSVETVDMDEDLVTKKPKMSMNDQ